MGDLVDTYRGGVRPSELDHMDHLNVASYVAKFDEGTWSLLARAGLTSDFIREHRRGMAGVEQNIRYLREVRAGDLLLVRSGFLEVKDKAVRVYHEMANQVSGDMVATMELVALHFDLEARRVVAFPDHIRERAREFLVERPTPV